MFPFLSLFAAMRRNQVYANNIAVRQRRAAHSAPVAVMPMPMPVMAPPAPMPVMPATVPMTAPVAMMMPTHLLRLEMVDLVLRNNGGFYTLATRRRYRVRQTR